MIYKVFAVLDIKAGYFSRPWYFPSTGEALRTFQDLASDMSTLVGKHPGDFSLYMIGTWNDASGQFDQATFAFEHLGNAVDFIPRRPSEADLFTAEQNAPFRNKVPEHPALNGSAAP